MSRLDPHATIRSPRLLGAAAGIGLAVLVVGAALASGVGSPPSATGAANLGLAPSASPATSSRQAPTRLRARLLAAARRTDRASLQVRTRSGWVTIEYARGTIESATASALTVKLPSGGTVSWAIGSQTTMREGGKTVGAAALEPGEHVLVLGTSVPSGSLAARRIWLGTAGPTRPAASPDPTPTSPPSS
jgi:hypothetical protein